VLNLYKIKLEVVVDNNGAINLYKKNGFKIVGTMKKDRYINGEYVDVHIMERYNNFEEKKNE
jgi:putative acetyltransferase